jgi:hypothetical protein
MKNGETRWTGELFGTRVVIIETKGTEKVTLFIEGHKERMQFNSVYEALFTAELDLISKSVFQKDMYQDKGINSNITNTQLINRKKTINSSINENNLEKELITHQSSIIDDEPWYEKSAGKQVLLNLKHQIEDVLSDYEDIRASYFIIDRTIIVLLKTDAEKIIARFEINEEYPYKPPKIIFPDYKITSSWNSEKGLDIFLKKVCNDSKNKKRIFFMRYMK